MLQAQVASFFHTDTSTFTYVVYAAGQRECAIIDSVLDYDAASGRSSTVSAQKVVDFVRQQQLDVQWILETHAHADHLSAAVWLQEQVGGKIAIGEHIKQVQSTFSRIFNIEAEIQANGTPFDTLFKDQEQFQIGAIQVQALHVPGHTPADMAYHVQGLGVFVGDTLFLPDVGTARCDFPGGSASQLYESIQRLLALPAETVLFMCHDYPPEGREPQCQCTVQEQKEGNIHVHDGISVEQFCERRTARDKTLGMPRLILPSIQVNIRAGHFPKPESNGQVYLKLPVNQL
ncbi:MULTISPECIES: MBL fold metallo-hydrolase [Alcaligenes]|jgi:glyoxylase-like metal-dependent hydrolase (beta-lactamase superfamily II)|uniref:MBL fold metallo-hydrolase n=1 Tax=Alcaligenes faecalis TaxID=511 RepID=A0AB33CS77_ALCFA|nr:MULTISPECIES: MBL fold metallo-hydrolase [Alcaligenes]ASR88974.1 MBL fold metallo-hydrolase [Alcaligenes faecalis]AWG33907.1 MBL fold metallo-hydrolase [Alcaligenes aquatilis]